MEDRRVLALVLVSGLGCGGSSVGTDTKTIGTAGSEGSLRHEGEVNLENIVQLTRGQGENAEAYWSFDGQELIFQTRRPPFSCDQIMRMRADGKGEATLVSTGKGRTTCSYFLPGDQRVVWSSTHEKSEECPKTPDMSQGYVWPIYPEYEIFTSGRDGEDLARLTKNDSYDAEATVCAKDGSIIFTSMRDGDLDLYRMDKDGQNVVRLTDTPGYDGGAFFSNDCKTIVWRASRPQGKHLEDYKRLLGINLVRPSRLEVFVADADGQNARQVTYLGAASFAPYLHPSGKRILFSTNYPNPRGREFDIWAIDVDGTDLERITYAPGFDGFPMFSPDGTRLAFASNRNQKIDGETDVYVARWNETGVMGGTANPRPEDRYMSRVSWLADDAREGRGIGTNGLGEAARWLAEKMAEAGAAPGNGDQFLQELSVPTDVSLGPKNSLRIDDTAVAATSYVPASFSANASASGRTVYVGYGLVSKEHRLNDYRGKRVRGRVAVIRRFTPDGGVFDDEVVKRRLSDLHFKAFTARERGAVAAVFVDPTDNKTEAGPLPALSLARLKDIGIPVVVLDREQSDALVRRSRRVEVAVELIRSEKPTHNVVGVVRAGAKDRLPGAVVVGAHYDHLGLGDEGSLEPGVEAAHNGADDNASGTAGLLEVVARLVENRETLRRDVYVVAFTAEERGLLGSSHFVRNPPPGLEIKNVVAMLNMDMIGRLRNNKVAIIGGDTATEWRDLVAPLCSDAKVSCALNGGGYGPSDQTPFYAAGAPVLHFFTGAHSDYHKTTDDAGSVNASGAVRVAQIVGALSVAVANREGRLSYQRVAPPPPEGDARSFGASMGTIPDYAAGDDGKPGVLLSGVRPGGPADDAGITGKDRILRIGESEVRTVQDLVYVLRQAKPGQRVPVVLERAGKKMTVRLTFGKSRRRMR